MTEYYYHQAISHNLKVTANSHDAVWPYFVRHHTWTKPPPAFEVQRWCRAMSDMESNYFDVNDSRQKRQSIDTVWCVWQPSKSRQRLNVSWHEETPCKKDSVCIKRESSSHNPDSCPLAAVVGSAMVSGVFQTCPNRRVSVLMHFPQRKLNSPLPTTQNMA